LTPRRVVARIASIRWRDNCLGSWQQSKADEQQRNEK
jgi:hypothetical protein